MARRSPRAVGGAGAASSGATPTGKRGRGIFDDPSEFASEESDDGDDEQGDVLKDILASDDEESDGDADGDADGESDGERELVTSAKGKRVVVTRKERRKEVVNNRAMLHVTHNFNNWDNAKNPTKKKIELTDEWKQLFVQAKADRHSVCCSRCLWSVKHEDMSTTQGMLMHLLCPSCYEGKPNVVTQFGWLAAVPRPMWKKFVNTAVVKWERQEDPVEDDVTYFMDEVRAASVHNDEFETWFAQWCVKEKPINRVTFNKRLTPDLKVAAEDASTTGSARGGGMAMAEEIVEVIASLDLVIPLLRDALAAGSTEAATALVRNAAAHVLEARCFENEFMMRSATGKACVLGPKGLFYFMRLPKKQWGDANAVATTVAQVQKFNAVDTQVAIRSLEAKRVELELRRGMAVKVASDRRMAALVGQSAAAGTRDDGKKKDDKVPQYEDVCLEEANAPSALGKKAGQLQQQLGKKALFVHVRGRASALYLEPKNGPVSHFAAARLQIPLEVSGNPAVTAMLESKAYMFVNAFDGGKLTADMRAVLRGASLPTTKVLMSARDYWTVSHFVTAMNELARYSAAVFTGEEAWADALESIVIDMESKRDQNVSKDIISNAWDNMITSALADATGSLGKEGQRHVSAEEQVQAWVDREKFLLPDLYERWVQQLALQKAVAAGDKARQVDSDRRERERDQQIKAWQQQQQKVVQWPRAPPALAPKVGTPGRDNMRSASPWRHGDHDKYGGERRGEYQRGDRQGDRYGRGGRDRDRDARRSRSQSGSRSRSRSRSPPRQHGDKKPGGGAGGAGGAGRDNRRVQVPVVVQKKPQPAGGKPGEVKQLCRFHFSKRGCLYPAEKCNFSHDDAAKAKH